MKIAIAADHGGFPSKRGPARFTGEERHVRGLNKIADIEKEGR